MRHLSKAGGVLGLLLWDFAFGDIIACDPPIFLYVVCIYSFLSVDIGMMG